MPILENIAIALASLKANKIRSFLTMLGIIIGIAAVICITSLGTSLSDSMRKSFSDMGANNIKVSLRQKVDSNEANNFRFFDRNRYEKTNDDLFKKEMVDDLREHFQGDIENVSYNISMGNGVTKDGENYANVSLVGISEQYFDLNEKPTMIAGSLPSEKAINESRSVALVSNKYCDNLFGGDYEKALNKEVEVIVNEKFYHFIICGVYEYEQDGFQRGSAYDITTTIYTSYGYVEKKMHTEGFDTFTVAVNLNKYPKPDAFAEKINSYMSKYYHNNSHFGVNSYSESAEFDSILSMINGVAIVISAIASISLFVAGVGVMNIMLVSVTERTKEIGTRKALGATNSVIRMQFVIESAVLCLIGGIIGIVSGLCIGAAGVKVFSLIIKESLIFTPDYQMIAIAIIFSTAVGVVFGYYPANKAATMNPIDALRY